MGRRVGVIGWGVAGAIVLAGALAQAAGLRINTTASLPRGLWQAVGDPGTLKSGDVVTFCPPLTAPILLARERGYLAGGHCPGNLEPMMKPIAALPGDRMDLSAQGVRVNGRSIPRSTQITADSGGRPLPSLADDEVVPAGAIWVVSSHNPRSYDSRYFGSIPLANVTAVLRPVWTETSQ